MTQGSPDRRPSFCQLLPHPLFCQCGGWRKTVEVNLESLRQVNRVANFTAGFF
jgi:hypothetical protein